MFTLFAILLQNISKKTILGFAPLVYVDCLLCNDIYIIFFCIDISLSPRLLIAFGTISSEYESDRMFSPTISTVVLTRSEKDYMISLL